MADLTHQKRDRGLIQGVLEEHGAQFKGQRCNCPFHKDKDFDGNLFCDKDGFWRFKCHAGKCGASGDVFEVKAKLTGRTSADIIREITQGERNPLPAGVIPPIAERTYRNITELETFCKVTDAVDSWDYENPDTGAVELVIYRMEEEGGKKSFKQASPRAGGWVFKTMEGPKPLYNRAGFRDSEHVLFVEGEKAVELAKAAGIPATTIPGGCGASKSGKFDLTPLVGKRVYLWPDNDEPDANGECAGMEHMKRMAGMLEAMGIQSSIVDITSLNLPPKGDIEQFLSKIEGDALSKKRAVWEAMKRSVKTGAHHELTQSLEEISRGERTSPKLPWPKFHHAARFATPCMVSVLVGEAGAGKSFFLIECAVHWYENGVPFAFYALEDEREFHMRRALAQHTGNGNLGDVEWVRENADEFRDLLRTHKDFIDGFGASLNGELSEGITKDKLIEWVYLRVKAGAKVIIIDPITMTESATSKPWLEDKKFMADMKRIARDYKISILLASHPSKESTKADDIRMGAISGGASISRAAHKIVWIQHHVLPIKGNIRIEYDGTTEMEYNRTLHILKSRDTPGQGSKIAMTFGSDLKFKEVGTIIAKASAQKEGKVISVDFSKSKVANLPYKDDDREEPHYAEEDLPF